MYCFAFGFEERMTLLQYLVFSTFLSLTHTHTQNRTQIFVWLMGDCSFLPPVHSSFIHRSISFLPLSFPSFSISSRPQKYPGGPLSIYFGSQTGTAEGFAKELAEDGKKAGFNTKVCISDESPSTLCGDCFPTRGHFGGARLLYLEWHPRILFGGWCRVVTPTVIPSFTKVHDLEDFDPEEIVKDEAAIYLMATYGGLSC
jgi:hypothetical protein